MKDLKENKVKNRFFIKGILFILPVFLSCWIIINIVQFMSNIIPSAIIDKIIYVTSLGDKVPDMALRTILGFILTVILIYISGLSLSIIGKKFFNKIEKSFFYNIPFFGVIYKTIKQILDSISNPSKNSFKKVVMVEFPRKEVWTLGFVTGESKNDSGEEYYHVIVPTTPNPTSAYLLFILKQQVKETDISIDEGIKAILSGGVVTPDKNYL
ncbi:MAG: hypothetical protein CMG13_00350 [Candidatus Marinimicrobia bacterium]|nr:hypothetical protein [Candidatus Neomarinimicrobiota bacterium]|tara:strand:- start:1533 stop:2168 length:636 start_codon:yes stop_codon:yes gene_type:complete